jgi:hypothetical protein
VETPFGIGQAILVLDYGMHQNTCWVVTLQKDGLIKYFDCNDVRLSTNYTNGMNLRKNKFDDKQKATEYSAIKFPKVQCHARHQ